MFKRLFESLEAEGLNERPGQLIFIDTKEDGSIYHLPKKPYRMYLGLEDGVHSAAYESAVILLANFTNEEFVVEVVKGPDPWGAVSIGTSNGGVLPAGNPDKAGHCTIAFAVVLGNVELALEPYRSTPGGTPNVYRRFYTTYDVRLNDQNGNLRYRIDPELIVEGRP